MFRAIEACQCKKKKALELLGFFNLQQKTPIKMSLFIYQLQQNACTKSMQNPPKNIVWIT